MATSDRVWLMAAGALLALSLVAWPTQAGTPDAPEITDPAGDQEIVETVPACAAGQCAGAARIDATAVWVDGETATSFNVNILTSSAPGGATAATSRYEFHATYAGTEVVSVVTATGGATVSPPTPTANVASAVVEGNVLIMTIDKSVYGAPKAGEALTGLFYFGISSPPSPVPTLPEHFATDRAPDAGAGTDYVLTGGGAGGSAGDADGDGLNDTWEADQFGNITRHNGTSDPDDDGLNNTREFALGTNATNADTDGDGLADGEDPDPLVPAGAANDTDGDGLNDTWEREHFTTLPAQAGTGDPDADGLNNTRELALGTDPNDADTDGDGLDDGEDPAPLVPSADGGGQAAGRKARPELYAGSAFFAISATFILLGLAKGI